MLGLNNLKIGTRLAGAFIAVILLLLGISYTGWHSSGKMFASLVNMYGDSVVPLRELSNMQVLASRNRILAMDMIINTDPANVTKRSAEMVKIPKIDASWKVYLGTDLAPEEKTLLAEIAQCNHDLSGRTEQQASALEQSGASS